MKRHVVLLTAAFAVVAPTACSRDEVTGVPALSPSRSGASNTLRDVIVFSETQPNDRTQIGIMNPDGSGRRLITDDPDHTYLYPAISPDGRRIAATRFTLEDGFFQSEGIFLVNADGSGETLLVSRGLINDAEPAWSPDGSQIAFQTFDMAEFGPVSRIYVINVDGTGLRPTGRESRSPGAGCSK
jgi:Tol biopolymer transport system component